MLDLSQCFIIAGMALLVLDMLWCACIMVTKHNVLRKSNSLRRALSFLLLLLMLALCGFFGYVYAIHFLSQVIGILVLCVSVLITVLCEWSFSQLHGTELHAMELLQALVGVIEAGDPNLDGHSLFVRDLTMLLYDNLPFRYRVRLNADDLQYAALLLDIGKLGVPRAIINKSGKLEKAEWNLMRRHPEIGAKILQPIPSFHKIAEWITYHHERVDGSGYFHLKDDEIPLASRIIAIADTYSALTMDRNYKPSQTYEEAIGELKLVSDTQLDGELVQYFCAIPPRKIEESMTRIKQQMRWYQEENFR